MKVARWVLRETTLGNKCRPPDSSELRHANCADSGQKHLDTSNGVYPSDNLWYLKHDGHRLLTVVIFA